MPNGTTIKLCPYHSYGASNTRALVEIGNYTSPSENQSEQYANFAIAFDEFCIKHGDSLITELDSLYDVGIDRYTYMLRIRTKLYESIMESAKFPMMLNSGISTFFLVINGIFLNNLTITEGQVKTLVIQWAGSIKREILPPSNDPNITESYKNTVRKILDTPDKFLKNTDNKKEGLPCPIIFSKKGKQFLMKIIGLLFQHIPKNK